MRPWHKLAEPVLALESANAESVRVKAVTVRLTRRCGMREIRAADVRDTPRKLTRP